MTGHEATFTEALRERLTGDTGDRVMTFLSGGAGPDVSWTFAELDRRASAIGALLRQRCAPAARVLLLHPPGLDYVATFVACQYAGMIAVPAYPPSAGQLARSLPRLHRMMADAGVTAIAGAGNLQQTGEDLLAHAGDRDSLVLLDTGTVPQAAADGWCPAPAAPEDVVFLQYTSGTTCDPRGVRVTQRSLLVNSEHIRRKMHNDRDGHMVSWLPPFHDMGLIGSILQALYSGMSITMMAPLTFVRSPLTWLRAISGKHGVTAGSPNFGFDLCLRKTTPQDRASLDLSGWEVAFCGAEPVRAATMNEFARAFAVSGFRERSLYPCYGLAEGTLMVSGGHRFAGAGELRVDGAELERGRIRPVAGSTGPVLVSTGSVISDHEVRIVDPSTGQECPHNEVGEVWFGGDSIADGYWRAPGETAKTFGGRLPDRPEARYLRTGDLGFLHGDELYITGRRSEVVIVAGRNFYPHDLEQTVEAAVADLRPGGCVAFSVRSESTEQLVIVQEISRHAYRRRGPGLFEAIRTALAVEHGVMPVAVVLVESRGVTRTSSGKVQRVLCRERYLKGELEIVAQWQLAGANNVVPPAFSASRAPGWQRHDQLVRYLAERIGSVLGDTDAATLDPAAGFMELGVSSALAVEIRNRLETELDLRLPASLLFDYPTIGALAGYLGGALATTTGIPEHQPVR